MKQASKVSRSGGFRCSWLPIAMLVARPRAGCGCPAKTGIPAPGRRRAEVHGGVPGAFLKAFSCTSSSSFEVDHRPNGQQIELHETRRAIAGAARIAPAHRRGGQRRHQ